MNITPSSDDEDDSPFAQKYIKTEKLAEGTYGIVWKARNTETGQFVAIKIFKNLSHEGMPVSAIR
jgi:serine/threonine protein kinase